MVSFAADLGHTRGVDIDLDAGEHQKVRLVHVGMVDDGVVVCQAKNLVAESFVAFLYFFRRQFSVGNGAVGVQICFVKMIYLGE